MSDFFSQESRTSPWVKLIFLLSLLTSSIGAFFGGAYFFCGDDIWIPGVSTAALALIVFLTVPKCAVELEKWGRYQSKFAIWGTFVLGLTTSGIMVLVAMIAWQGQTRWSELVGFYGETLEEGEALVNEYEVIRDDYFVLLGAKMTTGFNQSQLGNMPSFMTECPISLSARGLSESVVSSRLATLRKNVDDAESDALETASRIYEAMQPALSKVGIAQRCEVPEIMMNFQETVSHLDKVMREHISDVNCTQAPIGPSHGPWLDDMDKFKEKTIAALAPQDFLNGLDIVSALGALFLLLCNMSPVLLGRTTQSSSSMKDVEGTEI